MFKPFHIKTDYELKNTSMFEIKVFSILSTFSDQQVDFIALTAHQVSIVGYFLLNQQ